MRRIARTVAASVVIILGLALVSAAAVGANSDSPIGRPSAPDDRSVEAIPPFKPEAGKTAALPEFGRTTSFDGEFGKRAKRDILVRVTGGGLWAIRWRDDLEVETGFGNAQRTRTITSGLPVTQVAVNGGGRPVSCSITIDGVEKDRQTATTDIPVIFCEA